MTRHTNEKFAAAVTDFQETVNFYSEKKADFECLKEAVWGILDCVLRATCDKDDREGHYRDGGDQRKLMLIVKQWAGELELEQAA